MENVHPDILVFLSHVSNHQNPKFNSQHFCEIVTPAFVRDRQTKDYVVLAPATNHQSCLMIERRYDTCYALREREREY